MKRLFLIPVLLVALSGFGLLTYYQATATVNEVSAANRYTANGATTVFSYGFKILANTDIEVSVDNVVKALTTDYTVSGVGASGGGSVTFLSAPANGAIVTLLRKQPVAQSSTYTTNEAFPASRLEKDFDKLVMQLQQIREQLRRGLFFAKSSSTVDQNIDTPVVGSFARAKVGGGIDWATVTSAGSITIPVPINEGGTGATTAAGARTNLLVYSENTLIDAKGDLLVGASDNTLARLAPPTTTGFVPTYDPSATNFISWGPRSQPNPIINGNMEIWQRGTTFSGFASNTVLADRWKYVAAGSGVVGVNRSANVPTVAQAGVLFNYSFEVDVTTGFTPVVSTDLAAITHRIEGYNWRHFAQRDITLSFWVMSSKTGTHCVSFTNVGGNRTYVAEYTVNAANTWEYKTLPISASPSAGTWDYTNNTGLTIAFTLMAGSNYQVAAGSWQTVASGMFASSNQVNVLDNAANFFRLTGVKLELGSIATPIQFVPFEEELFRCQRYFEKSFGYATTPAQSVGLGFGEARWAANTAGAVATQSPSFPLVRKRQLPAAATLYNPSAANSQIRNTTDGSDLTGSFVLSVNETSIVFSATGTAGTAIGEVLAVYWTVDAEL